MESHQILFHVMDLAMMTIVIMFCIGLKKAKSPMSYADKMKNRVNFRKMMILELNRANCGELLSEFHQGHQPDGSPRAPKVKINKRNVENYQVYHYEA